MTNSCYHQCTGTRRPTPQNRAHNARILQRCRACNDRERNKKPKGAQSGGVNMAHRTGEHITTSSDPQIRSGPSAQPQGAKKGGVT